MNKNRIKLFKDALLAIEKLIQDYPDIQQFESVKNQLNYLLEIEENKRTDIQRLKDIIIGIITVREIEDRDMNVANLMYEVTEEVKKMKEEKNVKN